MKRFLPGRWKGEGGGVDRKRLLGHANALAEMHQRPGEPGEAGGVKRVAAVGVWFQKAGKGMEGFSTGSGSSGIAWDSERHEKHGRSRLERDNGSELRF